MADMRMMQEQNQLIQNLLGSIAESIKAVNARLEARIDEQASNTGRALADQKLVMDNLSNNVREIREKLDDTNVRLGTLNTEVDALRQGVQQLNARPAFNESAPLETGAAPAAATAPGAPGDAGSPGVVDPGTTAARPAPPVVPIGTSPQKLFESAQADYTLAQYDLAISGFEAVIQYFPERSGPPTPRSTSATRTFRPARTTWRSRRTTGRSRTIPKAPGVPDAYYRKGIALKNLKQPDRAREAFEYVVKTYPDSDAALLARQQLPPPAR